MILLAHSAAKARWFIGNSRTTPATAFPDFDGLSDKWNEGAEYICLYPNVLLAAQREHAYAIILQPIATDRTIEHVHIYYAAANTDADLRRKNTAQWKEIFEEDIGVVEGMQRGRAAPGFDGGRFSPAMDSPTHCFHDWIAARLGVQRSA